MISRRAGSHASVWYRVALCTAAVLLFSAIVCLVLSSEGLAQGIRHPFAVGANEGVASTADPFSRFLLAQESGFYRLLTGAVRSIKETSAAAWGLVALSFAYGVVHAAGPGHGKAVIASYLLANERTFARGVVISAAAAFLQGSVAIAIVGAAALLFQASSKQITAAASLVEIASYAGITILGIFLVYKKSKVLLSFLRATNLLDPLFAVPAKEATARTTGRMFVADNCVIDHIHDATCRHAHAIDPRTLSSGQDWKGVTLTIIAAGARPCSGAILVLVFAVSQSVLPAGILSVAAMSLGTAITTSALAAFAVLAKNTATRLAGPGSQRARIVWLAIEVAAAAAVLALGIFLLATSFAPLI